MEIDASEVIAWLSMLGLAIERAFKLWRDRQTGIDAGYKRLSESYDRLLEENERLRGEVERLTSRVLALEDTVNDHKPSSFIGT